VDAPINVRIVQKSNTDNVRVFGTIQAALASITTARRRIPSGEGHAWIYDLGTASLQMKDFVTLEGAVQKTPSSFRQCLIW